MGVPVRRVNLGKGVLPLSKTVEIANISIQC